MAVDEVSEESTLKSISTDPWDFAYYEAGEGRPLILLHGSGPGATGWSNFRGNIGAFAENFRTIAVDMPGWGRSSAVKAEDRDHVEGLRVFLDAMGIDEAALVGNSMGGGTALRFVGKYPERVSHLIPMGAGGPGVPLFNPAGLSEGIRVLQATYKDPSPENFKQLVSIMAFDPKFATDELAELRSQSAMATPQHLENFVAGLNTPNPAAMADFQKLISVLPTLDVPTLAVHGRDDRVVHYENSLRIVSLMPNSRLLLINRCGHWAMIEHEAEFNRAVTDFILHN